MQHFFIGLGQDDFMDRIAQSAVGKIDQKYFWFPTARRLKAAGEALDTLERSGEMPAACAMMKSMVAMAPSKEAQVKAHRAGLAYVARHTAELSAGSLTSLAGLGIVVAEAVPAGAVPAMKELGKLDPLADTLSELGETGLRLFESGRNAQLAAPVEKLTVEAEAMKLSREDRTRAYESLVAGKSVPESLLAAMRQSREGGRLIGQYLELAGRGSKDPLKQAQVKLLSAMTAAGGKTDRALEMAAQPPPAHLKDALMTVLRLMGGQERGGQFQIAVHPQILQAAAPHLEEFASGETEKDMAVLLAELTRRDSQALVSWAPMEATLAILQGGASTRGLAEMGLAMSRSPAFPVLQDAFVGALERHTAREGNGFQKDFARFMRELTTRCPDTAPRLQTELGALLNGMIPGQGGGGPVPAALEAFLQAPEQAPRLAHLVPGALEGRSSTTAMQVVIINGQRVQQGKQVSSPAQRTAILEAYRAAAAQASDPGTRQAAILTETLRTLPGLELAESQKAEAGAVLMQAHLQGGSADCQVVTAAQGALQASGSNLVARGVLEPLVGSLQSLCRARGDQSSAGGLQTGLEFQQAHPQNVALMVGLIGSLASESRRDGGPSYDPAWLAGAFSAAVKELPESEIRALTSDLLDRLPAMAGHWGAEKLVAPHLEAARARLGQGDPPATVAQDLAGKLGGCRADLLALARSSRAAIEERGENVVVGGVQVKRKGP